MEAVVVMTGMMMMMVRVVVMVMMTWSFACCCVSAPRQFAVVWHPRSIQVRGIGLAR